MKEKIREHYSPSHPLIFYGQSGYYVNARYQSRYNPNYGPIGLEWGDLFDSSSRIKEIYPRIIVGNELVCSLWGDNEGQTIPLDSVLFFDCDYGEGSECLVDPARAIELNYKDDDDEESGGGVLLDGPLCKDGLLELEEEIFLEDLDGKKCIYDARDIFPIIGCPFKDEFGNKSSSWLNNPSPATTKAPFDVNKIYGVGTYRQIFSMISDDLESLVMTQAQIIRFSEKYYDLITLNILRRRGFAKGQIDFLYKNYPDSFLRNHKILFLIKRYLLNLPSYEGYYVVTASKGSQTRNGPKVMFVSSHYFNDEHAKKGDYGRTFYVVSPKRLL